jgi:hypothetical protein
MARIYVFGPFRLDPEAEILFKGTEPVGLGRRAVALLRILVERPGEPVSKDELIEAAWTGVVVEEANLTVQMMRSPSPSAASRSATWLGILKAVSLWSTGHLSSIRTSLRHGMRAAGSGLFSVRQR